MADRYKLVYRYEKGGAIKFVLNFENGISKSRFPLTILDAITSNFANDEELATALNKMVPKFYDGHFVIEYTKNKANLVDGALYLVYNDMTFLSELARENIGASKLPKSSVAHYLRWFLDKVKEDSEFLEYLSENEFIDAHFKRLVSEYLFYINSFEKDAEAMVWKVEVDLVKKLMNYKVIRGIEIGRKHFELKKANLPVPTIYPRVKKMADKPMKKVIKRKNVGDGQLSLFDASEYEVVNRTKK